MTPTTKQKQALADIRERLFALRDEGYRNFQSALMPTVDRARVLGVRTPALRRLAQQMAGSETADTFLTVLPHEYYEEDNLHAFLISRERDFSRALALTEEFLPHIDNWATCDSFAPPVFAKHLPEMDACAERWMSSEHPYVIRYGIGVRMRYFLGEAFVPAQMERIAKIANDHYYVRMMVAWYVATAVAKQPDTAVALLESRKLDPWTHNKAIRKARESFCVDEGMKRYLQNLKL